MVYGFGYVHRHESLSWRCCTREAEAWTQPADLPRHEFTAHMAVDVRIGHLGVNCDAPVLFSLS